MAESSFPWVGGGAVDADGWRGRSGSVGNGTMGDFTGTAFNPTVTGADKVVTVAAGRAMIQNATYLSTAAIIHNIGATGTAPTSGQYRWDYIALRFDPTEAVIADRVKQVIIPGTPSTTPAFPALEQDPDGVWEEPLVTIKRGPGDVAINSTMVAKVACWTVPTVYVPAAGALPSGLPDAGIAFTSRDIWHRTPSGYVSILDPSWSNLTLASGYSAVPGATPQYRVRSGGLELRGIVQRSGSAWVNGAAFASFSVSVNALLPSGTPAAWHRHGSGVLYASTSAFGVGTSTAVRVQMNESGGIVYLPNSAGANSAANRLDLSQVRVTP